MRLKNVFLHRKQVILLFTRMLCSLMSNFKKNQNFATLKAYQKSFFYLLENNIQML